MLRDFYAEATIPTSRAALADAPSEGNFETQMFTVPYLRLHPCADPVGEALDETAEGPHAVAGADFLRSCGEPAEVCDGVAGHHGEVERVTLYATLASVADALSSARPGARSENMELYLGRIERLERIATSFPGVSRAFAVQAGRDLRVLVDPEATTDEDAMLLASRIGAKIEQELQFPGQIRVTVIREKRCVEYAR